MSQELKSHGSPEGNLFGIINTSIQNDENKTFNKVEYDTLNVGWELSSSSTPTLPPAPTPTIDPLSLFSCSEIQVTGSTKCSNVVGAVWSLLRTAKVSCSVSWTYPASPSNVVTIYGIGSPTESLDSGETKYTKNLTLNGGENYSIKFARNSTQVDYVKIKTYISSGSNFFQGAGLSYCSGSDPVIIHVHGITGSYKYHSRENSSQDKWSGVKHFSDERLLLTGSRPPTIYFGEVVGSTSYFSFPLNASNECGDIPIPPSPSPTPPAAYCQQLWIDYDYLGRASASWIDCGGTFYNTGLLMGTPYTTAMTACHRVDTLSIPYGVNFRFAECGDPDPRANVYQIDATSNADGIISFTYLDAFGNSKSIYRQTQQNTTIYGLVTGQGVSSVSVGDAELSSRPA